MFLKYLATATTIVALWGHSALARPGVPITDISFFGYVTDDDYSYIGAYFTVPDQNTTHSAGGGLRRYDVHLAKMFEVTDWQCRSWQNGSIPHRGEDTIAWVYRAGNGSIPMGIFTISCQEARNVMTRFTVWGPEKTKVNYLNSQYQVNIPTLRLTGSAAETSAWMRFVQTIPPQSSP